MTRTEIAADLRRHTGGGMITAKQLAEWLGLKQSQRVADLYLRGLEHIGQRYLITEVAQRLKESCVL